MPGASELLAHPNLVEIYHRMPINFTPKIPDEPLS
jgi:hypothetical protein